MVRIAIVFEPTLRDIDALCNGSDSYAIYALLSVTFGGSTLIPAGNLFLYQPLLTSIVRVRCVGQLHHVGCIVVATTYLWRNRPIKAL